MALHELVAQITRDADLLRDGHQLSAVYMVLCIVMPIAMGLFGAALGFVAEKLLRGGGMKE